MVGSTGWTFACGACLEGNAAADRRFERARTFIGLARSAALDEGECLALYLRETRLEPLLGERVPVCHVMSTRLSHPTKGKHTGLRNGTMAVRMSQSTVAPIDLQGEMVGALRGGPMHAAPA